MSSKYVRDQVKNYITTNLPGENLIDFSGESRELSRLLTNLGLGAKDPFLGIQFVPSDYAPSAIVTNNVQGFQRERGALFLHVVQSVQYNNATGENVHQGIILNRSDTLLDLFQGARINSDIYVERITPPNFDASVTLNFERGFESAALIVEFYRDRKY